MVQEDKNQRLSKKLKDKKTPQRGLGVAQLEKIRLEEECKNINLPTSVCPPPLIPISSVLIPVNANVQKFWNSSEGENLNLKLIQSFPPHPSMEMTTFSTSPPVVPFPTEPPSNQSDSDTSIFPNEHKVFIVARMKRAYPFALESQAGPSCETKRFAIDHSKNIGSDESSSGGNNGGTLLRFKQIEPTREAPVSPTLMADMTGNEKKGFFDTDFLTLAPPTNSENSDDLALFESLQTEYQRIKNDQNDRCLDRSTPFYNFIQPAVNLNNGFVAAAGNICGCEEDEAVDLCLKL